ncbi:hypothetical protein TNCV_4720291 [Trichonephila clavipes]|uniref:Uncharacterized protein n=1 Tax=Trichonephila clavipes TaxID=2585209 RepID=A0A8X6W5X4_TRICX|nr:hypothetical protein TNCV_4720291 [Trichonephila clavipes]
MTSKLEEVHSLTSFAQEFGIRKNEVSIALKAAQRPVQLIRLMSSGRRMGTIPISFSKGNILGLKTPELFKEQMLFEESQLLPEELQDNLNLIRNRQCNASITVR